MSFEPAASVNAHTHLYSGLVPLGMPSPEREPRNFVDILESVWWRLDRALDADSLSAAARFYLAEARMVGTVAVIDHHESPNFIEGSLDVLGDACQALGVTAVLCYGATERNGGPSEAKRGLLECRRFIRTNRRRLVRGVIGLHASFTVSDDTIRQAAGLAKELGTVLHVHVAEDRADVEDARQRGYAGVVDRLDKLGALVPGSIFAHGVHLTADEVRQLADNDIWLVQNPRSNANNKVGYPKALASSRRVALGTDGFPADMEQEAQALRKYAADEGEDPQVVEARTQAGAELMRELIDGPLVGATLDFNPEKIRTEAELQAARLWERMKAVS